MAGSGARGGPSPPLWLESRVAALGRDLRRWLRGGIRIVRRRGHHDCSSPFHDDAVLGTDHCVSIDGAWLDLVHYASHDDALWERGRLVRLSS